uniref:HMG box domain-containing protein n=1 Tax=Glossina palpalis gambiensis TaxID=67801 RepID=A0A1B0B350_9MUSC
MSNPNSTVSVQLHYLGYPDNTNLKGSQAIDNMAPKKACPNAFMIFTMEWKAKHGRHLTNLSLATAEAGKIWENMNAQERGPYKDRAKAEKLRMRNGCEKLTCVGTPISEMHRQKLELEQKEKQIKRTIEQTVRNSKKNGELENKAYFFIAVNYFTKTSDGSVYIPAELSICEYSLKQGVIRTFHTFINPGVKMYGHQLEAQRHSDATHGLPFPPNAMGDKNLGNIYNAVLKFLSSNDDFPPLYTSPGCIHIVDSVLNFLKSDIGANNATLSVYSIQYLFYVMKEATCDQGELEKPKTFHITDAYFERDYFEYQSGIACQFHEDKDRGKYCTQSLVIRWGYMFSEYMCQDIAISLIPGRHVPRSTNLKFITSRSSTECCETKSLVPFATTSKYSYENAEAKLNHDYQETAVSLPYGTKPSWDSDFPTGVRKRISLLADEDSGASSSRKDNFGQYYAVLTEASRSFPSEASPPADSNFKFPSNRQKDQHTDAGNSISNINIFNTNSTRSWHGRLT